MAQEPTPRGVGIDKVGELVCLCSWHKALQTHRQGMEALTNGERANKSQGSATPALPSHPSRCLDIYCKAISIIESLKVHELIIVFYF